MAAPVLLSIGALTGNSLGIAQVPDGAYAVGDTLVVAYHYGGASSAQVTRVGGQQPGQAVSIGSLIRQLEVPYSGATAGRYTVWTRVLDAQDLSASKFLLADSGSSENAYRGFVAVVRGVNATQPVGVSSVGTSADPPGAAQNIVAAAESLLWLQVGGDDPALGPGTPSTNPAMTHRLTDYNPGAYNGFALVFADPVGTAALSTGPRTATGGSSAGTFRQPAFMWTLRPVNTPPGQPTPLFPTADQSLNRLAPIRFSWQPNDDAGDVQSKFLHKYRLVGSANSTQATVVSPTPQYDLPAGTLAAGKYAWSVRTYDGQGLISPESPEEFFTAATPPPGPTWTSPVSGQVISGQSFTATYSAPDQVARQTRIVADLNGAPDEATVLYGSDSGRLVTGVRSVAFTFPVNSVRVHLQVRVENGGLWGPYATVPVQVSYTRPPIPTVTVTTRGDIGGIAVQLGSAPPTAGQPTVTQCELYARATVGDKYRPFPDGTRIARLTPTAAYIDQAVASAVDYSYRVVAVAANGTTAESGWIDVVSITTSNTGLDPVEPTVTPTV